jgi:hypothetical protein
MVTLTLAQVNQIFRSALLYAEGFNETTPGAFYSSLKTTHALAALNLGFDRRTVVNVLRSVPRKGDFLFDWERPRRVGVISAQSHSTGLPFTACDKALAALEQAITDALKHEGAVVCDTLGTITRRDEYTYEIELAESVTVALPGV